MSKSDDLEKLLDNWNQVKKKIELERNGFDLFVRNREIWYINMGKNIGFESNGKDLNFKRPILILKIIGSVVFIASMTTKGKDNKFYHKLDNKYFDKESFVTLSQVKIVDKKRFIEKIGQIDKEDFIEIKNKLKNILF